MIAAFSAELGRRPHDVCIIGSGPVGITLALELARLGRSALVLESGDLKPTAWAQALSDAAIVSPQHHPPMFIAVQRSLGGASNLWGGRCVPLDPLDFEPREAVPGSGWPIGAADLAPYLAAACRYAHCGEPHFTEPLASLRIDDPDFSFEHLERWSARPRFKDAYLGALRRKRRITLALRASVAGLRFGEDGRVAAAVVRTRDGAVAEVAAPTFVLAAGGLENTRLLLAAQAEAPARFGGLDGPLGRYYMGHTIGCIANVTLDSAALDAELDYVDDGRGAFRRRRFTPSPALQAREAISNIALWPEFPPIYDPGHGDAVMSLGYLALSSPFGRLLVAEAIRRSHTGERAAEPVRRWPHVVNLMRGLPAAARFLPGFVYGRYIGRPRLPGFFQTNAGRRYALRYQAEHAPHRDSRVVLSDARDATGLRRLEIDLRFKEADVQSIVRAHECFADWLQRNGLGRLDWRCAFEDRAAEVLRQSYDGHHQIGTIRMADTPWAGVVDRDGRVYGSDNLFVAGSAVFPSSSQANPTFTALVLAVRMAEKLASNAARPASEA